MKFTLLIIIQIISIELMIFCMVYLFLKAKRTLLLTSLVCTEAFMLMWTGCYTLEIFFAKSGDDKWLFLKIEYFAICFAVYSWLIFSFLYTGSHSINIKKLLITSIIPISCYLMVITNDLHHLVFKEIRIEYLSRGPFFGVLLSVLAITVLISMIVLLRYSISIFGDAKRQSILLLLSVFIPFILGLFTLSIPKPLGFDIVPASFSISAALVTIATFKYKFLDVARIAYEETVKSMKESIVILDTYNNIVTFNESFINNFGKFICINKNDNISNFIGNLKHYLINIEGIPLIEKSLINPETALINIELSLTIPFNKSFIFYNQPVLNKRKKLIGKILSFYEITEYKNLLTMLEQKNQELTFANRKLEEHALKIEELAVAEERTRVAREIHDTLGHTMTSIITLLEMSLIHSGIDITKVKEDILEALVISKDGLRELRSSIHGITLDNIQSNDIITSIKHLITKYKHLGIKIDFSFDGSFETCPGTYVENIYRICQEAMTNAVRHGKAKNIIIILQLEELIMKLYIFDDGIGCNSIKKGMGLSGIEQRVNSLKGKVLYGSSRDGGFNINIEIPLG